MRTKRERIRAVITRQFDFSDCLGTFFRFDVMHGYIYVPRPLLPSSKFFFVPLCSTRHIYLLLETIKLWNYIET